MKRVEGIWAELSAKQSQEVELAKVQDLKSLVAKYNNLAESIDGQVVKIANALEPLKRIGNEIESGQSKLDSLQKELFDAMSEISEKAKELGLSANDIPEWKNAKALYNEHTRIQGQYDKAVRAVDSAYSSARSL
jgi:cell fate (sporulation/competence/biofilm development) regulator YlbF (YheA/YmcA/DUF963 family)